MVSLRSAEGRSAAIYAGPEVRNFDQINVGDEVVVTFYAAIGASDGIGFGSSSPCLPFSECPDGTGYVQILRRNLVATGLEARGHAGCVRSRGRFGDDERCQRALEQLRQQRSYHLFLDLSKYNERYNLL